MHFEDLSLTSWSVLQTCIAQRRVDDGGGLGRTAGEQDSVFSFEAHRKSPVVPGAIKGARDFFQSFV